MLRNRALCEQDGPFGVEAYSQQAGEHFLATLLQLSGILSHCNSVEIDYGKQQSCVCGGIVLQLNPLLQRAEIIPQMRDACGLDAGEDRYGFRCAGL
jgi:hypothetical protein